MKQTRFEKVYAFEKSLIRNISRQDKTSISSFDDLVIEFCTQISKTENFKIIERNLTVKNIEYLQKEIFMLFIEFN